MDGEIAKQLGTGSAQIILGIVVVALAFVAWTLAKSLIDSYKERIGETRTLLQQKSEDGRLLADALKDMKATLDLALAALKVRP